MINLLVLTRVISPLVVFLGYLLFAFMWVIKCYDFVSEMEG